MTSKLAVAKNIGSVVTLNDSVKMPLFGLGVFRMKGADVDACVQGAFKQGYRLLDTAKFYENEAAVGEAIKKSGLKREEVFVVTKLWLDEHGFDEAKKGFHASLKRLGLDYVDLYLIHAPSGGKLVETYKALVDLKKDGLIRSIGVSNFGPQHLEGLKNADLPTPSVNQIQLHVYCQNHDTVKYCEEHGIAVMGYSPLIKGQKMDDPKVVELAKKYNKTVGQFLIRWSVQNGFITIPKTSNPDRLKENADVFDWAISDEDMQDIAKCSPHNCTGSWNPINDPWTG